MKTLRNKIEQSIIKLAYDLRHKGPFETISFYLFGGKRMLYI